MTTSRRILGLAGQAVSGAASAARHPVAAASYAIGFAKGATSVTLDVVRHLREGAPAVPHQRAASEPTTAPTTGPTTAPPAPEPTVTGERTNFGGLNTEAAEPRMPGGGGEPMAHEPHAESREVEHGEAPLDPREEDSWLDEALPDEDLDLDEPDPEPLLDPATTAAVRTEAETLGKAADPEKE